MDQAAFEAIVREHVKPLRAFLATLGVHGGMVDDLAQDVFLEAAAGWERYDDARPLRGWLFGIARNLVRQEWRRQRMAARVRQDPVASVLLGTDEDDGCPLESLAGAETTAAVRACLDSLAPAARDIVLRRYRDDEAAEDISRALKRNGSAVRMALLRAREVLRACIERRLGTSP